MATLECALLSDGSSDAALIPIIKWVVKQHAPMMDLHCEWADMRHLYAPPRTLAGRIVAATELYPCDVLFVHRDAEAQPPANRYSEIQDAVNKAHDHGFALPHVCVVPVRMQEAWLLLDESAIRRASGNPNGRVALTIPKAAAIEALPDPKAMLHDLLAKASEFRGRRLQKFRRRIRTQIVTAHMRDFAGLRRLPGFQRLETDVKEVLSTL